uniref:transmembrane protein 273-like isoform X1 n=1 Tax=Solea senegalensis TaxID=28829 RepID=UPI001CD8C433|nr:transmembrane protein 273-like isoform X1 [Solea senegalensis]
MTAPQMSGCVSTIIPTVLIVQFLLMSVRGDGADSGEELDLRYVFIGTGVGVVLAVIFVIYKLCLIRKQALASSTGGESAEVIGRDSRRGMSL